MRHTHQLLGILGLTAVLALAGCTKKDDTAQKQPEPHIKQEQVVLDAKNSKAPEEIRFLGDEVTIKRVIDGDTVVVTGKKGDETVRLSLIDAPESVHPTEPEQRFGHEASEFVKANLTVGMTVILERGYHDKDMYDRTLGYLWVGRVNFNQLMVDEGYARMAHEYSPNEKYVDEFREAETRAKLNESTIWSIKGYVTDDGFDMSVVNQ